MTAAKISKKVKAHLKKLTLDHNCPNLFNEVNRISVDLGESARQGKIPTYHDIKELIGYFKLTTETTEISENEIISKFNQVKSLIEQKQLQANLENKKLLVVLGESHGYQSSIFFEMATLSYLKTLGFNSLLQEADEEMSKNHEYNAITKTLQQHTAPFFAKSVLGYELNPIDPMNSRMDNSFESATSQKRNGKINESVSKHNNENQVLTIGTAHLEHVVKSEEINKNFVVVAISFDFDNRKLPRDFRDIYTDEALYLGQGYESVSYINFDQHIESFSSQQMYDIYNHLLPLFMGEEYQSTNQTYHSKFLENPASCEMYPLNKLMVEILSKTVPQYHTEL